MTDEQRIGHGKPGPGRPPGSPNRTTRVLKDAIIQAATEVGVEIDCGTPDGLVGYLKDMARNHKKSFAPLLGKIVPMAAELSGADGAPLDIRGLSDAELQAIVDQVRQNG